MLRAIFIAIILAGPAQSGAWLREAGEVFLSPSFSFQPARGGSEISTFAGLYAEWGLSPSLTLGFDLGHAAKGESSALIFARVPLLETANGLRMAADFGLGLRHDGDDRYGFLRSGLSFGYGFSSRRGNGWLGLDLSAELDDQAALGRLKADLTLGLTLSSRVKAMLQWHALSNHGKIEHQFVPSIVLRSNHRQFIQFSAILGRRSSGLKLALWQSF